MPKNSPFTHEAYLASKRNIGNVPEKVKKTIRHLWSELRGSDEMTMEECAEELRLEKLPDKWILTWKGQTVGHFCTLSFDFTHA